MAAYLGDEDVAAFNASYKIIYMVHQFVLALGIATTIRLGIALGQGDSKQAKFTTVIGR